LQEGFIVSTHAFKRRIGRWTDHAGIVLALIPEFLVHAVMEIIKPFGEGLLWRIFMKKHSSTFTAELAG